MAYFPTLTGGDQINIAAYSKGTLARYASTSLTVDLTKDYIIWTCLLQDDATYRAGSYKIEKGVLSQIAEDGAVYYITATISGSTVTLTQAGALASNSCRYGVIQIN